MYGDLFQNYKPESLAPPAEGFYRNWLGLVTDLKFFSRHQDWSGKVIDKTPGDRKGDGIYGGDAEYASVLLAVENRKLPSRFVGVELGAGWGPWVSAAGVASLRNGIADINLVAVEADELRCEAIQEHLNRNGLTLDRGVKSKILHGAAWYEDTTVRFGNADSFGDHGGAATAGETGTDYRGHEIKTHDVKAYSLPTICSGFQYVDYMHWDIQGAELPVAEKSIEFLNWTTRYLFIGTHSIAIHGKLIELFFNNGWDLIDSKPPEFTFDRSKPTLEGMVTKDGDIFLVNTRLVEGKLTSLSAAQMKTDAGILQDGVAVSDHRKGFVVTGPYLPIPKGRYEVKVTYSSDSRAGKEVGWIDVTACIPGQATVLRKELALGTGGRDSVVSFMVEFDEGNLFEARVYSNGRSKLAVKQVTLQQY
ncbi:hypothetical protein DXT97_12345 [Agrobacterium tumefaciens]|uniref:hypothetical protein n=1 Tax=Agrobacterium tumefaciens TaxID=358 RepID=UPI001295DC9B|nr:hypothetical protein [Agrobacterium tumefaciens]MQB37581.1 hypothetical protein [Agrobacterium tumefaciens]